MSLELGALSTLRLLTVACDNIMAGLLPLVSFVNLPSRPAAHATAGYGDAKVGKFTKEEASPTLKISQKISISDAPALQRSLLQYGWEVLP